MRVLITGGSGFIGTNLVQRYGERGDLVLNLDRNPPRNPAHEDCWSRCDLLDRQGLFARFTEHSPEIVLHFGARTDLGETRDLSGYAANVEGVANVIAAVRATPSVERVIFTSSQLVCRIGYRPQSDTDYCPSTLYGESKRLGECLVREANLETAWTLVRPTSIWGPWFDVPYRNFFEAIRAGRYVHPGGVHTPKQWGYVGNVVHQVEKLIEAPAQDIRGRTFYLADYEARPLREIADAIQRALGVRPIPEAPTWMLRAAARAGDLLQALGWSSPPLTSFRYGNIRAPEIQDMEPLRRVVGPLPYSLEAGIEATVAWMRDAALARG